MTQEAKWNDEETQQLKALWTGGKTATEIMVIFSYKYTRSAIMGKIRRLNLLRNGPKEAKPAKLPAKKSAINIHDVCREKHEQGLRPIDISLSLRKRTSEITSILVELGLDPSENITELHPVHPIWHLDDDDRRAAFQRKASKGASEALRLIRGETVKNNGEPAFEPQSADADRIISEILSHRKVGIREIMAEGRPRRVSAVRAEISYWLYIKTNMTYDDIAAKLKLKMSCSVRYAAQTHAKRWDLEAPKVFV